MMAPTLLAEAPNGMVVVTTGERAARAGRDILARGGNAVDAALTTALAQVVECGGAYVSHAGILSLLHYEASTGTVSALDAGYDIPLAESDALSIPEQGTPSGRATLVPGFMAGVGAAHDRFGSLSLAEVFAPAIAMARDGFAVSPLMAKYIDYRQDVLGRLPQTRRIFVNDEGRFLREGEHFRQPELADTLESVVSGGTAEMYTGAWARRFVDAVQAEGGKISLEDMRRYRPTWRDPLGAVYRDHRVVVPGLPATGGVAMIEALRLIERADLRRLGPPQDVAQSLFHMLQIGQCQFLEFLPDWMSRAAYGRVLSLEARAREETTDWIWSQMQSGAWAAMNPFAPVNGTQQHSDGVVAFDRAGNMVALTHTINTDTWGTTGLFVGGVSVPDSAAFQQLEVANAGPGNRLPNAMSPMIFLRWGRPVLGSSAIGTSLHEKTLAVLAGIFEFGLKGEAALTAPSPLFADYAQMPPVARVEEGTFAAAVLEEVRRLGQPVVEVGPQEAGWLRGYWVGLQRNPVELSLKGLGEPAWGAAAEGH
jgi:gamma-glutamyltranspeptidase/glutathione hydrolase